jgi:transketolase
VGIAESNMISVAAGFSKQGFVPVVDTFAQFGVTKGALPLTMAMLSQAPMICVFSHTGFQDAADGASHQALTYLSMVAGIPGVQAIALNCSEQAEALVSSAIHEIADKKKKGEEASSYVFFLGRENFPKSYGVSIHALSKANVIVDKADKTKNVLLLTGGSLVPQALAASEILATKGIGSVVVDAVNVNHIDVATIKSVANKCGGNIVTVEDHQLIGGLGAIASHALLNAGVKCQIKSLGVREDFGRSAYNAIELYRLHGIDAGAIVEAAMSL